MLDKTFIIRKIELIQQELEHLKGYTQFSFDEIAKDYVKQTVVERILERIINRGIDINQHIIAESEQSGLAPMNYRDTFIGLVALGVYSREFAEQISKSIGTRNKLVHEYDHIDERQVYDSIKDCLTDYTLYCTYILNFFSNIS